MTTVTPTTLANLRHELQKRQKEVRRLERDREKLERKFDRLAALVDTISKEQPAQPLDEFFDAILRSDVHSVKRLIVSGIDPNIRNKEGDTALLAAAYSGASVGVVRALLSAGAEVDKADDSGNTPLLISARDAQLAVVRELIKHGADVNHHNADGDTPLTNAACWGSEKAAASLLRGGADPSLPDGKRVRPVDLARHQGHSRIVKQLERALKSN